MSGPIRVAYTLMQCWHRVPGGSATAVLSLAEALARRDDVDLVGVGTTAGSPPSDPFVPPVPYRSTRLPYQAVYELWNNTALLSPSRLVKNVDIVHATTTMVPSAGKAKLVVTVHDLFPLHSPEQFTPRGVRLMTKGIEKARKRADLVIVPSEDTARDCVEAGFAADRLRVIPWGTSHRMATADERASMRAAHGLERPFILWVGTVEPRKNLPLLIDAYTALPSRGEIDLVLVGPSGWDAELVARIDALGDSVRRLGFVSPTDLTALYAEAELVAVPSTREGFGLPALEGMAQGTPVLAGAGTAVAEVVGAGGLALPVAPGGDSVEAWTDALARVLADPAGRTAMGVRAWVRSQQFRWEKCASQHARAYREVLQ
ncbi:MAG: glycosyltransferase family 4 protein [Actinobacteria bacterium]|nr:glycosyltransferase family 4 protein [Actinomycetota bacterium]